MARSCARIQLCEWYIMKLTTLVTYNLLPGLLRNQGNFLKALVTFLAEFSLKYIANRFAMLFSIWSWPFLLLGYIQTYNLQSGHQRFRIKFRIKTTVLVSCKCPYKKFQVSDAANVASLWPWSLGKHLMKLLLSAKLI